MSMKIYLKSKDEDREAARASTAIVASVLDAVEAACKPGATTWDLNEIADGKLKAMGATSAFLGYHGYPAVLCTSVNEVVVHGIPRKDVVLKDGDIIGIDFGCFKDGFCGDSARTIAIGKATGRSQEADGGDQGVARARHRAVQAGQSAAGHRLGGAVARRAARLLGGADLRRPRHRPGHARGPAGAELRHARARGYG